MKNCSYRAVFLLTSYGKYVVKCADEDYQKYSAYYLQTLRIKTNTF